MGLAQFIAPGQPFDLESRLSLGVSLEVLTKSTKQKEKAP